MPNSTQSRRRAAFEANKATREIDHVARIDALTRNARSTWFGLLAALVFVGVTLAGVEHIDFYGVDRATALPLVNVSVPTRLFFLAAPVLTAAIYVYFHLYLIRLFDALGKAPAQVGKEPLSNAIAPWLINDAALWMRRVRRGDGSHPRRALEDVSAIVNVLLVWVFGLFILGYSWVQALPARDVVMNGIGAAAFTLAFAFALASWVTLRETTRPAEVSSPMSYDRMAYGITAVLAGVAGFASYDFANPESPRLAALDLSGEEIVEKPDGWLPYEIARKEFLSEWKAREGVRGELTPEERAQFDEEWNTRRALALANLKRPPFDGQGARINLRNANLTRSFLPGLNLNRAKLSGINLTEAQIEGVDFTLAQMKDADLSFASMEGAILDFADFEGSLGYFRFEKNSFRSSRMQQAALFWGRIRNAKFTFANLREVQLHQTIVTETDFQSSRLEGLNADGSAFRNSTFWHVDFDEKTDFRNAFFAGTLGMNPDLRERLGDQCQSRLGEDLSDEEFFGRWRGWIESRPAGGFRIIDWPNSPQAYHDATPIPPDPGCEWKTGPMPPME